MTHNKQVLGRFGISGAGKGGILSLRKTAEEESHKRRNHKTRESNKSEGKDANSA